MAPRDVRSLASRLIVLAGVLAIVAAVAGIAYYALAPADDPEQQVLATARRYNRAIDELDWQTLYNLLPEASQQRLGRDCMRIFVQRSGSAMALGLIVRLPEYDQVDVRRGDLAIASAGPSQTQQFVREGGRWRVSVDWSGIARLAGLQPPDCQG